MFSIPKSAALVAFIVILSILKPANATPPASVQALSAAAFLDSVGINTHMGTASTGNLGTSYGNPTAIARELQYTGIKHVRDDFGIGSYLPALQKLNAQVGARFDLAYSDYASNAGSAVITSDINNVQSSSSIIEAIEGPNEPDLFGVYYNGVYSYPGAAAEGAAVVSTQQYLYSAVAQNSHFTNVPVYCPALSYPAPDTFTTSIGNLSAYCNYSSVHIYPNNASMSSGYLPHEYIGLWAAQPPIVNEPGKTVVITAGGWETAKNSAGIDEATQSKYLFEYLLDAFSVGIPRTYLNELSDRAVDSSLTNDAADFGIFHFSGTPKAAATMLANLNSVLRSGSVTPASLSYSVDNMPPNGHQLLLEKSNGTFVLALWNEANLWDEIHHVETPLASVQVLLNLGALATSVQIYDPLVGTSAQATYSNIQGLTINIPDHPILVAITTTSAPTSVPAVGACGAAGGQTFSTIPATNLCSSGAASTVISNGAGAWLWTCTPVGGASANCHASTGGNGGSCGSSTPPSVAAAVGYNTNTFSTSGFSPLNVDIGGTYAAGFQWYLFNFFGSVPTAANVALNSDGSVSAGQGGNDYSATLSSAGKVSGSPGYVGTAFGGGAYIEGVIKFNAQAYNGVGIGWPAFWTYALEANLEESQWPGQAAGYAHFLEADILEYFQGQWFEPLNEYSATVHDWYGMSGSGTNYGIGTAYPVSQADFSHYNTVAMLWVPATNTTNGYINFYWNGNLVSSQRYTQLRDVDQPPPSPSTPWAFGIIDQDHMVIEFGSDNVYPIIVKSVNVWQASGSSNLTTSSNRSCTP